MQANSKVAKPDRIRQLAQELGELVAAKNVAYGDAIVSVGDALRLLYPQGIRPEQYNDIGLIVRVWDKLSRVANDKGYGGESPWRDISGYGILGAVDDDTDHGR
jgi:hypothetical protein